MTLEEAKKQINKDRVCVAFIFQTVFGIPLEVFDDWSKDVSYLKMAKKCAYWRNKMPEYFKPISWKN